MADMINADVSAVAEAEGGEYDMEGCHRAAETAASWGELDPGFHARAVGIATELVADAVSKRPGRSRCPASSSG